MTIRKAFGWLFIILGFAISAELARRQWSHFNPTELLGYLFHPSRNFVWEIIKISPPLMFAGSALYLSNAIMAEKPMEQLHRDWWWPMVGQAYIIGYFFTHFG